MNKPLPWNVKGVGFDAREAARLAAKRAGVPLGDWLNSVIAQRAAELGVQVEDVEAEDRLDAIASRLSEAGAEKAEVLTQPERSMRSFATSDAIADTRVAMPASSATVTPMHAIHARFAAPQGADLGRVAASASAVSRRSESSQSAQLRAAPPSRSPTDQLDDRLNSILAKLNRSFEAAAEISEAVVERKPLARQAETKAKPLSVARDAEPAPRSKRPEPFAVEEPSPRAGTQHPVPFADLQHAFKALAEKLEAQLADTGAGQQPPSGQGDRRRAGKIQGADSQAARSDEIRGMQRELAQLAAHVADLTPQRSLASLEAAVRDLAGRVDLSRLDGVKAAVLAPVERLGQDMRDAIRSTDATAAVDAVRREVKTLAAKLDSQAARGSDDRALEGLRNEVRTLRDVIGSVEKQLATSEQLGAEIGALGERIDKIAARSSNTISRDMAQAIGDIRELLQAFRPGAELSAIDRKIDHLSARIEMIAETRKPEALFDDMARQIDRAHEALMERLNSRGAPTPNLGVIEESLDALSAKIDTMSRASQDVNALYGLVGNLADRMQDARDPQADAPAFAALQTQIAQLVERLDRSDSDHASLRGLETLIGDLFLQIEQSRNVAIDAAENAARAAAQDTLRAAMDNPTLNGAELTVQTGLDVEHVSQELAELRRVQEASDRRITTTLTALNTTLERLVDHMVAPTASPVAAPAAAKDVPQAEPMLRRKRRSQTETVSAEPSVASELPPFDPEQFLVEPGSLARATEGDIRTPQVPGTAPVPNVAPDTNAASVAPLIAAARRAAQAAQESALEASLGPAGGADKDAAGAPSKTKSFFASRRRPLLLALAGVVLLLGTLQIVRLSTDQSARDATVREPAASTSAPIDPTPAPEAPKLDKGAALESAPGSQDLTPTGSVAPPVTAAADPAPAPVPSASAAVPAQELAALTGMMPGLRDLAASGDAAAQFEVAVRLSDGKGVTRDAKAAVAWFERAAKQGLAPAQYRLGSIYEKGVGVGADPALATAWYEKAAAQGNIRAMHNLAVMSAEGAGSRPDYGKAVSWFTKAASYGVRDSQYNLAVLFARGLGVPQNLGQSYAWFALAAQQGDADAVAKRDAVAAKLDAKALADAKAMVASFRPLAAESKANDVAPPPGGWDSAAPAKTASARKAEARVSSM